MLNSSTNYPILTTRRIVVSQGSEYIPEETSTRAEGYVDELGNNRIRTVVDVEPASTRKFPKIKVEFLLKTQEPGSLSRWLSEAHAEYAQYLKVYFFVLNDETSPAISFYQDIETRYPIVFNPQFLYHPVGGAPIDTASISFSEILQNNFYVTTPVSDLSEDYYHDIYGEIEIELSNINLGETDNLHLIGLIHMDAERYLQDNGIAYNASSPHPIMSRGGNLVYDTLLKRGATNKLEVPLFRNTFYVNEQTDQGVSLEPYYGPVHYHDSSNPGPGGYIGWMAGHEGGQMGPRLETREIRNYKVVSSIYDVEDSSLYSSLAQTGFPAASSGHLLESYISSIVDEMSLLDSTRKLTEMVNASDFAESQKANNFMKMSSIDMTYITSVTSRDANTGELTNETSHHAALVGVDYYRLVRSKSNYGDILNFHHNAGNYEIVDSILSESRIINLEVLRERVTNNAYSFNHNEGLQYKTYDLNEPRKTLVNSRDELPQSDEIGILPPGVFLAPRNKLVEASSQLAGIKEIDLVQIDPSSGLAMVTSGHARYFCIKDYDLFHNVQRGKYRHNIKMTIRDGVYVLITKNINLLDEALRRLRSYIIEAEKPVLRNANGLYVEGNYDTRVNDFHDSFKARNFSATINLCLDAYRGAVSLITGRNLSSEIHQLRTSLDPRSTNLETLGHFSRVLSTLLNIVDSILRKSGDGNQKGKNNKRGNTHIPASGPAKKCRHIEIDMKCPDIVHAIPEGAILANYSNYGATSEEGSDITPDTPNLNLQDFLSAVGNTGRITNNSVVPVSYLRFSGSPYIVRDYTADPGALQPSYTLPADNSTSFVSKAAPTVISTYSKFVTLTGNKFNNEVIKINIMRSEGSVDSNIIDKGPVFLIDQTLTNAGISISPVKNLNISGLGSGIRLGNPSSTLQKIQDLLQNEGKQDCFNLSDELKAALQAAAFNGVTREEILDIAESNFADLNEAVETLGPIFDTTLRLASSLQSTAARVSANAILPTSEKDKFMEDGKIRPESELFGIEPTVPYESDRSTLVLATPGSDPIKVDMKQIGKIKTGDTSRERYVFIKMQPNKKEDAIISVNDGYLLRV